MLRLQQTIGNQAVGSVLRGAALARHAVATTDIHRAKRDELFGDGTPANPGMTFSAFVRSTRAQADWFVEPSLSATDRDDLWKLLRKSAEGSHILAGTGDLKLADLVAVTDAQWTDLANFGRACDAGGHTVRVLNRTAYALAKRVSLGGTLAALEAVIAPAVLELTVSELQLDKVDAGALVPKIDAYWKAFQPHLQRRYVPGPGAIGEEFKLVLDLVAGPGIALFGSLNGRIRNLHRFTLPTLVRQVINFANHTRAQPVQLVLHTGHDESSFTDQVKANLEDLVTNTPNLVLILEGQAHLKDITAAIPTIAADYGQPDKSGTPRIAQAMIAGHGEARMVEMAGTGAPNVHDNRVDYPKENLNLDDPVTSAETVKLMDTLVGNLDPATARLVFLGCLVGSNPVPLGTATADMAAHIAGRPSLATFAEQRGAAAGLAPGFTQASRASVGAKATESLHDGKGNLAITYKFDPDAFGTALAYVATGREPEGLMRAAVEVAATDPLVAAHQLRLRQGLALPGWYGEMSMVAVNIALDGVAVGAPVDPQRLNKLAHMVGTPFLAYWSKQFGRNVSTFRAHVNPQGPLAGDMFKGIAATPTFAAADFNANVLRLIVEQAWIEFGEARQANLMAFLDATAGAEGRGRRRPPRHHGTGRELGGALPGRRGGDARAHPAGARVAGQGPREPRRAALPRRPRGGRGRRSAGARRRRQGPARQLPGGHGARGARAAAGRRPSRRWRRCRPTGRRQRRGAQDRRQSRAGRAAALRGDRGRGQAQRAHAAAHGRAGVRARELRGHAAGGGLHARLGRDRSGRQAGVRPPQPHHGPAVTTLGDWRVLPGGSGTRLALAGDRTVAASLGAVAVWSGTQLEASAELSFPGRPQIVDGSVYCGDVALDGSGSRRLPDLDAVLREGTQAPPEPPPGDGGYRVTASAWAPGGDALVVTAAATGLPARALLLDGSGRRVETLWEGGEVAPGAVWAGDDVIVVGTQVYARDGRPLATLEAVTTPVRIEATGARVLVVEHGRLTLWDRASWRSVAVIEGGWLDAALSDDGLAAVDLHGALWLGSPGDLAEVGQPDPVQAVALSGARVVASFARGDALRTAELR